MAVNRSFTILNQNNVVSLALVTRLPVMKDIIYQERLEILKLPTLAYRQTRGDMIEVYKLLQGKYDIVKLHKDSDTKEDTRVRV